MILRTRCSPDRAVCSQVGPSHRCQSTDEFADLQVTSQRERVTDSQSAMSTKKGPKAKAKAAARAVDKLFTKYAAKTAVHPSAEELEANMHPALWCKNLYLDRVKRLCPENEVGVYRSTYDGPPELVYVLALMFIKGRDCIPVTEEGLKSNGITTDQAWEMATANATACITKNPTSGTVKEFSDVPMTLPYEFNLLEDVQVLATQAAEGRDLDCLLISNLSKAMAAALNCEVRDLVIVPREPYRLYAARCTDSAAMIRMSQLLINDSVEIHLIGIHNFIPLTIKEDGPDGGLTLGPYPLSGEQFAAKTLDGRILMPWAIDPEQSQALLKHQPLTTLKFVGEERITNHPDTFKPRFVDACFHCGEQAAKCPFQVCTNCK